MRRAQVSAQPQYDDYSTYTELWLASVSAIADLLRCIGEGKSLDSLLNAAHDLSERTLELQAIGLRLLKGNDSPWEGLASA